MDRKTQALIAGAIVVLGLGVVGLGFIEEESGVRYVSDLHSDPSSHQSGMYTLIGELQPATLPHETSSGGDPNPEWHDTITTVTLRTEDTHTYRDIAELSARSVEGTIHWTLSTTTQRTDRSAPEGDPVVQEWTSEGILFQVADFESGQRVWAVANAIPGELYVKPSQMEGRIASDLPAGALVFQVDSLAQQCSSKFVPEDVVEKYEAEGFEFED